MISFKKITLLDYEWAQPMLQAADSRLAEYSFTNCFLWGDIYHAKYAPVNGFFVSRSEGISQTYGFPAGNGDLVSTINTLIRDAQERNEHFRIRAISKENVALLEATFPHKFNFNAYRDSFDYLYNTEDLITLSGKKYQPKRNHLSRFKKSYNWAYEDITPENIKDCISMNAEWCRRYRCNEDDSLEKEACAVKRALENFFALKLQGGLLRVDGKVIAYTVGEPLNSDTYIVHIEKAFSEFNGAYQAINNMFISRQAANFRFVNREDDAGDEGLRKAKLSYHPTELIEKYIATLRSDI